MKDRNKQVATALLIVSAFGIGIFVIRSRFSPEEDPRPTALVQRELPPTATNAIDVGPSPLPSHAEEGYSKVISGERYFKKSKESAGSASDKPLTEEECQAFLGHIEKLEIRSDPAAAAAFKDPAAVSAMDSMCKKGRLSPKFARCAMSKESTKDFLDCGDSEVQESLMEAKAVLADFESRSND